jgi:hypothetical protein
MTRIENVDRDKESLEASIGDTIFDSTNSTMGSVGNWTYFQDNTNNLLGKVLTILDASYADPAQREAVKSLVKDAFSNYRTVGNWTIYGTGGVYTTGKPDPNIAPVTYC